MGVGIQVERQSAALGILFGIQEKLGHMALFGRAMQYRKTDIT
jgi:hypothetical protein